MKKIIIIILLLVVVLSGCSKKNSIDDKNIIVAASITPHALILEDARSYIESKGYNLVIKTVTDYVIPNTITQSGEVDANFFQHLPYLEDFNIKNKTTLSSVFAVHFEPLGLYSKNKTSLDYLEKAKIGIPNDRSNGSRALLLLDKANIITVDKTKGLNITKKDILDNPYNVEILELEAAAIPVNLQDLDYGVINGNYALSSNINIESVLVKEDINSIAATEYANILVVKAGNENKEAIKVLIEAISQQSIKDFINEEFASLVIPVFN